MPRPQTHEIPITTRSVRIIALALLGGIVMFLGITAFLVLGTDFEAGDLGELDAIRWLPLALFVVAVPVGQFLRTKRYADAGRADNETGALQIYMAGTILFFAMLEAPAFFGIVTWLITGNAFPGAAVAGAAVVFGLLNLPGDDQFRQIRELGQAER